MLARFRNLDPIRQLLTVTWVWMVIVTAGLAGTLTAFFVDVSGRRAAQMQTNQTFTCDLDGIIDYLRVFNTATPLQLRAEKRAIDRTLTKPGQAETRIILDTIISAELSAPSLSQLHPFTLPDLPGCPTRGPTH